MAEPSFKEQWVTNHGELETRLMLLKLHVEELHTGLSRAVRTLKLAEHNAIKLSPEGVKDVEGLQALLDRITV